MTTDQPLTDAAVKAIERVARAAINALSLDDFLCRYQDDVLDDIQPDAFSEALELEVCDPHSAADISDELWAALSIFYSERSNELFEEGLI
jgi:hypothetical protein